MDSVNWAQLGWASLFGLVIGLLILGAGMWMDRVREARWNRELKDNDRD